MKRFNKTFDWRFWILMPILGILFPYVINLTKLTANFKIIVLLFIVNMIFSVIAGRFLRHTGACWVLLLVWPIVFLISVWLHINSMFYGYYLALLYLILEVFAFTSGQEEELDIDKQIPVDGGFSEV